MTEKIIFKIGRDERWGIKVKSNKVNPCLGCGNQEIFIWDCGYSTFNPGGACCVKCRRDVELNICDPLKPKKDLLREWNKHNPNIKLHLQNLDKSIKSLNGEKKRLKKLFKIKK